MNYDGKEEDITWEVRKGGGGEQTVFVCQFKHAYRKYL